MQRLGLPLFKEKNIQHYHHIKVVFLIAGDQLPLAEDQVDYILQVSVEVGWLEIHVLACKRAVHDAAQREQREESR
jgi:hypothetical protein